MGIWDVFKTNKSSIKLLSSTDTAEILKQMEETSNVQTAEQLRQLQASIYHLTNKINDLIKTIKNQDERLVQLTTAIEIIQNEQEDTGIEFTSKWPAATFDDSTHPKVSRKSWN
jgi:UTP-glucose-1-phosphate uridylyltransferase